MSMRGSSAGAVDADADAVVVRRRLQTRLSRPLVNEVMAQAAATGKSPWAVAEALCRTRTPGPPTESMHCDVFARLGGLHPARGSASDARVSGGTGADARGGRSAHGAPEFLHAALSTLPDTDAATARLPTTRPYATDADGGSAQRSSDMASAGGDEGDEAGSRPRIAVAHGRSIGGPRVKDTDWFLPTHAVRERGTVFVARGARAQAALVDDASLTRIVYWCTREGLSAALTWMAPVADLLHRGNAVGAPPVLVCVLPLPRGAVPSHPDCHLPADAPADAVDMLRTYDDVCDAAAQTDAAAPVDAAGGLPAHATFYAAQRWGAAEWRRGWAEAVRVRGPRLPAPATPSALAERTPVRPPLAHVVMLPAGRDRRGGVNVPSAVPGVPPGGGRLVWEAVPGNDPHGVVAHYAHVCGDASAVPSTRLLATADAARFGVLNDAHALGRMGEGDAAASAPLPTPDTQAIVSALQSARAAGMLRASAWARLLDELRLDAIALLAAETPFVPRAAPPLVPWLRSRDDMVHSITAALLAAPPAARARVWVVHPLAVDLPHLPACMWIARRRAGAPARTASAASPSSRSGGAPSFGGGGEAAAPTAAQSGAPMSSSPRGNVVGKRDARAVAAVLQYLRRHGVEPLGTAFQRRVVAGAGPPGT